MVSRSQFAQKIESVSGGEGRGGGVYIHGQLLNLENRINILERVYPLSFADWVFRIESWWCGRVFVLGECL